MGSSRLFSASLRSSIWTWWKPPLPSTFSVSPCPCRAPLETSDNSLQQLPKSDWATGRHPRLIYSGKSGPLLSLPSPPQSQGGASTPRDVSLASIHSSHTPLTGRIIWGKSRSLVSWGYDWSSKLLLLVIVNLLFQRPPSADPESCYLQTIFNNRTQLPHFNLIC